MYGLPTKIAPCCLGLIGLVEPLENRFDCVGVASGDVVEPCLDQLLVDRFAFLVRIAPLIAELDHQPHVFDLKQPLLLVRDELCLGGPQPRVCT
jgi:hypothetical protein